MSKLLGPDINHDPQLILKNQKLGSLIVLPDSENVTGFLAPLIWRFCIEWSQPWKPLHVL